MESVFYDNIMYIEVDGEDILNLRNAVNRIMDTMKYDNNYDPIEIYTLQNIIKQWEYHTK
jgi:hypothetical protein